MTRSYDGDRHATEPDGQPEPVPWRVRSAEDCGLGDVVLHHPCGMTPARGRPPSPVACRAFQRTSRPSITNPQPSGASTAVSSSDRLLRPSSTVHIGTTNDQRFALVVTW